MGRTFTRWLIPLFAVVALFAAACDNGNDVADVADEPPPEEEVAGEPDIVEGELHECAEALPVAEGLSVVESGLVEDMEGVMNCIAAMQSEDSVETVDAAYRAALDDEGWEYIIEQEVEGQILMRLEQPGCGFLMIMQQEAMGPDPGEGPPNEGGAQNVMAVASLVECEHMPPQQEMPPPDE